MRTRLILGTTAIAVAALFLQTPLRAHHAFSAEFDANRPIKVTGTITMVEWVNPHSWFHLDVKTPDGKVEKWMFEGGGQFRMIRPLNQNQTGPSLGPYGITLPPGHPLGSR